VKRTWMPVRALAAALVAGGLVAAACDGRPADDGAGAAPGAGATRAEGLAGSAGAEAAIAGLFEAMNANDPDRVLAHYHQGAELVQVACTEVRVGIGRVGPIIRMWQEDQPATRIAHQVVRSLELGPDAAVVAARGRNHEGLALFWTFVLRRDDGRTWLIVQEHQSWPDCREPRIHPMG
jgi:hypothetical protein